MTSEVSRPVEALLHRLSGGPVAGRLGMVAAGPGVGKTALMVHLALQALAAEQRVLHVAVSDTVTHVRAWYDEVLRSMGRMQGDAHGAELVALERRRMILSYQDHELDISHVGEQAKLFGRVLEFTPDLLIVDGLDAAGFATHREALAALSAELDTPIWVTVSSAEPVPLGPEVAFGLRLAEEGQSTRLHLRDDDGFRELPWQLDVRTHLLGKVTPAAESGPPEAAECRLFSGGAAGSEAAFGEAAARHGVAETHFTFEGHRQARGEGSRLLGPRELEAGDVSLVYVSRRLNRTFNEHGLVRKVLQTLWHMVSRSQQVFVVGAIQEDGTVVGGTGWSVELARMWSKELWVFDQKRDGWFTWDGKAWVPGEARIRSKQLCGTGTRYLDDNGKAAIDALFAEAFGR